MVNSLMPQIDSITMINSDYNGFICNIKQQGSIANFHEVRIIYNNKVYFFTFLSKNNYFKQQDINRILNSIKFE